MTGNWQSVVEDAALSSGEKEGAQDRAETSEVLR